jgi:hypothetical protein
MNDRSGENCRINSSAGQPAHDRQAMHQSVIHLEAESMPALLCACDFTTALRFMPTASLPGPQAEFSLSSSEEERVGVRRLLSLFGCCLVKKSEAGRSLPRLEENGVRTDQPPTLAISSLLITLTILNCSAWKAGSARNDSLPK